MTTIRTFLSFAFRIQPESPLHRMVDRGGFDVNPFTREKRVRVQRLQDTHRLRGLEQDLASELSLARREYRLWLDLDREDADAAIDRCEEFCVEWQVTLTGSIVQRADAASAEWFRLRLRTLSLGRPDFIPPWHHVRDPAAPTVSDRFRHVCEARSLRCLDFLWKPDESRFQAPQWYYALSRCSMGTEVAHPWLNESLLGEPPGGFRTSFQSRLQLFDAKLLRPSAPPAILRLINTKAFAVHTVHGPDRFLRSSLPTADFAYDSGDDDPRPREMAPGRPSALYLSRAALDAMLKEEVLSDGEYEAVAIHDSSDAVHLREDAARPMFTEEEEAAYRAAVEPIRREWEATVRPVRIHDINELTLPEGVDDSNSILSLGNDSVRQYRKELRKAGVTMPETWLALAGRIPHGRTDNGDDVEVVAGPQHIRRSRDIAAGAKPTAFFARYVEFAGNGSGDVFAFDPTSESFPEDSAVVRWNHETRKIDRYWPSVAAFVQELLMPKE